MNYKQYVDYILAGMLQTQPKNLPDSIHTLKADYFIRSVDRKLFESLLEGERDLIKLAKISKSHSRVAQMTVGDIYISEETIRDFRTVVLDEKMRGAIQREDWDEIQSILDERKQDYTKDPIEEYEEYKSQYSELQDGDIMGMSTGIEPLDNATLGLIPNHIWVCGAYYGYGKTYFAINMVNSVLQQGKRALFFSLEMTSSEIIQRLVSLRTGLNLVETVGRLPEDKKKLRDEQEAFIYKAIKEKRLIIDDSARDGNNLVGKMMTEEMKQHVDFVSIDYIQLLAGEDQYESLRDLTKKLQGATKKMGTTTLILSQVNNDSQDKGNFSKTDGFKGAGDIGQIANVAIKIVRERDMDTGEFSSLYMLRLTKVRHSKPCSIRCSISFPGGKIAEEKDILDDSNDGRGDPLQELFGL